MPTVSLNKKEVVRLLGKAISDEELRERIPMLGTDLEAVDNESIHVEIFPNRPDLLSEQGFARALSSFLGIRPGLASFQLSTGKQQVIIDSSVAAVRPSTACAIVRGLQLTDERLREIIQIQEKLHVTFGRNRKKCAIGIYPLDRISMPITYCAKKPADIRFRPLEATSEMSAADILSNHPKGKDFAHLLEGAKVYPLFIDAKGHVLSMPPIINSHDVGKVDIQTKDVFVECSGFDLETLKLCLNMVVTSLHDMGGKVESMELVSQGKTGSAKVVTPDFSARRMHLDVAYANRLLGLALSASEAQSCLMRMGYGIDGHDVLIPCYRTDIMHQADLAEDIAIAYGYENFQELIPNVATVAQESPRAIFQSKLTDIFVGLRMLEAKTYELTSKRVQLEMMREPHGQVVELANALNEDYNVLRRRVLPSLLETLKHNKHHELPQHLFCFGRVFASDGTGETGVSERDSLGIVLADHNADYTLARGVAESLFDALSLPYAFTTATHPSFIEGRCAMITVHGKEIGILGEMHPEVLAAFGIQVPVSAFEIDVDLLMEIWGGSR